MSGFIIATLLTLALAGSVLWVMPSPREKRLAEMRRVAMQERLTVRLLDQTTASKLFPWVEDYRLLILYEWADLSGHKKIEALKEPVVIPVHRTENLHELDLLKSKRSILEENGLLERFPEGAEALVHYGQATALLWNEKGTVDTVPLVKELLSKVQQILQAAS